MAESHAYGSSLCCISRRLFVLGVSTVMAVLCYVQLFKWAIASHFWDRLVDNTWEVHPPAACMGSQCYEVMSCYGLKDATLNVREPLVTIAGAVLLPFGINGAHHCFRPHLRIVAFFLATSAVVHLGLIVGDASYMHFCGRYPSNVIHQTMLSWLPPSPVSNAAKATLGKMQIFSYAAVAKATDDFDVLRWYYLVAGSLTLFLCYAAKEALWLGQFAEVGPIGLGMHYGLGQWDEFINHDAVCRAKRKQMRSKFIEDATLPATGSKYGSTEGGIAPIQVLLQDREYYDYDDDDDDDEEAASTAVGTDVHHEGSLDSGHMRSSDLRSFVH
jgi:hypothetical protein